MDGVFALPKFLSFTLIFRCRQDLCPALVQLLGSPLSDVGKRGKQLGGSSFSDDGRGIRGPGRNLTQAPIAKCIYSIAGELVRLVGPMASLRPTLESLFHRIILYPPPQHRLEALKVIKEVMQFQKIYFTGKKPSSWGYDLIFNPL